MCKGLGFAKVHLMCGQARLLLPRLRVLVSVGCESLLLNECGGWIQLLF